MNNLERYLDQVIEQKPVTVEKTRGPAEPGAEPSSNLAAGVLRRWYIVLLTFLLLCVVGLPAIWLLVKPLYTVTAAIWVIPILPNVLTGAAEKGEVSNYLSFVYTQAEMITSADVLQKVADDLAGKNLPFFEGEEVPLVTKLKNVLDARSAHVDPVTILRNAIADGTITAMPSRGSELIHVTMKSKRPEQAKQIVDRFVFNWRDVEGSISAAGQDRQLRLLYTEQGTLETGLKDQHEQIRRLAAEYGTTTLAGRQDLMVGRVTTVLAELTKLESQRINLEARLQVLEQTKGQPIKPEALVTQRDAHVNSDPTVQEIARNIIRLEEELLVAKQRLSPENRTIPQRQELLDAFRSRLAEKRQELAKEFEATMSRQIDTAVQAQLLAAKAELDHIKAQEKRLTDLMSQQESQTVALGKAQLQIEDVQFRMDLDQRLYETVCRRIQEMEMERKQPARIRAYDADITETKDKRVKYSATLIFGAFGLGCVLAFLRDKADKTLQTPDDVTNRLSIPIIGTITSPRKVKPALFAQQMAGDYQIIRTNLELLNSEGMPQKLAVTSPAMREGKTTFAINLATSMAKSGKKVLLVDGDLKKPDIAHILGIPNGSEGLHEVLSGEDPARIIRSISSSGLDVLPANPRMGTDGYELLASPGAAELIDKLSRKYDHVIIDTPPTLASPDALVWAKMVDGVILVSFAGQTTAPDLKEASEKLAQVRAKVLGTVLSNVSAEHSYHRHDYMYAAARSTRAVRRTGRIKKKLLLPLQTGEEKGPDANA